MGRHLYAAWFVNPRLPVDDQDREWVACIVIEADTPARAQAWGDVLAADRATRAGEPFLSSSVDIVEESARELPVVRDGERADDDHIGW
jgi:hypothetical protein